MSRRHLSRLALLLVTCSSAVDARADAAPSAEERVLHTKLKETENKLQSAQLEAASERAHRLIRYGVSAGAAGALYFRGEGEGVAGGVMPYLVFAPRFWTSRASENAYCAAEWTAPNDVVNQASLFESLKEQGNPPPSPPAAADDAAAPGLQTTPTGARKGYFAAVRDRCGGSGQENRALELVNAAAVRQECSPSFDDGTPVDECVRLVEFLFDAICPTSPLQQADSAADAADTAARVASAAQAPDASQRTQQAQALRAEVEVAESKVNEARRKRTTSEAAAASAARAEAVAATQRNARDAADVALKAAIDAETAAKKALADEGPAPPGEKPQRLKDLEAELESASETVAKKQAALDGANQALTTAETDREAKRSAAKTAADAAQAADDAARALGFPPDREPRIVDPKAKESVVLAVLGFLDTEQRFPVAKQSVHVNCGWHKIGFFVGYPAVFGGTFEIEDGTARNLARRDMDAIIATGFAVIPNAAVSILLGGAIANAKLEQDRERAILMGVVAVGGNVDLVNIIR